jgi:hypothetical protein
MVDARERRKAVDDDDLMPHFPIAVIGAEHLQSRDGIPPGTRLEWPLDRRELKFKIEGGKPGSLEIVQGALRRGTPNLPLGPGALPLGTPRSAADFAWGAQMGFAAPKFTQIDPRCFHDKDSHGLMVSRVIVDRGRLSSHGFAPEKMGWYYFDDTLSGGGQKAARPYSNKVALEILDVTGIRLVARDLDGERSDEEVALKGAEDTWVEITVANMDDGRLPERNPDPDPKPKEDADFKWFYELCANRQELVATLNGRLLPIPKPIGGGGPGAIQCMHATFADNTLVGDP